MLVGDVDTAQEIVQEAFVRSWISPKTPSIEPDFRRWLYRVIANLARDYHRERARRITLPISSPTSLDPLERIEQRSEDYRVLAAVRMLKPRERQAIYLRYFEDLSFADTSRILGSPQVSVRVLVHRALGKLRRQLAADLVKEVAV